jgi:hypothetical protein
MAGDKLIQTIQSMAKPPVGETTDLLFGEVTSVSPLKVRVDNRFEVDEQFLILSALVKETVISVPTSGASTHSHTIPQHTTSSEGVGSHTHTTPEIPQQTTSSDGEDPHTHTVPGTSQQATSSEGEWQHTHTIPEMTTYSAMPDILLWRGLIVGDKVRLLRVNSGQMFYIIEREEGVV